MRLVPRVGQICREQIWTRAARPETQCGEGETQGWVEQSNRPYLNYVEIYCVRVMRCDNVATLAKREDNVEKLDFIEAAAKGNAAFHLACAEALAKESNTLLTIVLTGAGASFGYAISLAEKNAPQWLLCGLGTVSIYLFAVAALTTWKCLWVGDIHPPENEPKNLIHDDFDVDAVRRAELNNKQECINRNKDRNTKTGLWLNRCRLFAAATPVVFAAVALVVVL